MLSIVTWKWGTLYSAAYINRLRNMLSRHLHLPHQLFCITDDVTDIDPRVIALPMFPDTFEGMTSPSGKRANFRRLRTFDASLAPVFGPRMVLMDIDVVMAADITPIFDRSEPLVCYDQRHDPRNRKHNTSVILMDTGILDHMWQDFKRCPESTWQTVKDSKIGDGNNSDQAVFGYYVKDMKPATWDGEDGMTAFYRVKNNDGGALPVGLRMILFFGNDMQDDPKWQEKCPWIVEHWW